MHRPIRFQWSTRLISALALVGSQSLLAASPQLEVAPETPQPNTVDLILAAEGVLQGYVVNAQGVPASNVEVTITTSSGEKVQARSDLKGRFGYRGLEGGTYLLATDHGVVNCRAWHATTAPPRAAATLLMVHDENLVRGQWSAPPGLNSGVSRMKRVMTNPFAVATIIGAAVAIPVAIHNANQDDSNS